MAADTVIPAALPNSGQPNARAAAARLLGVLSAAQRLAGDIEQEASESGFDLATALQCVLADAQNLALDVSEAIDAA